MTNSKFYFDNDNYVYISKSICEYNVGDYRIKYIYIPQAEYKIISGLD